MGAARWKVFASSTGTRCTCSSGVADTRLKTLRISRRRSSRGCWKKETCHARHPHGVASGRSSSHRCRTFCSTNSTGCARSSAAAGYASLRSIWVTRRSVSCPNPPLRTRPTITSIAGGRSCCSTVACTRRRLEYERAGKSALFERLVGLMTTAGPDDSCREAAADLAMTEGAVKVAVHRMRRRFRDVLRAQIAETVDPDEVDDEIAFLIRAVGRPSSQP